MLRHLYIRNFTLIDELDISLDEGFSVITGETGAGKSIILGAIGLLLGQRADPKSIKKGTEKSVVEAHFDLTHYDMQAFFDDNELDYDAADTIIRREITESKSRAFINDAPVTLALLRELGEQLMDIHSQHQNLLLGTHDFQMSVVDIIAHNEQEREAYRKCYDALREARRETEVLKQRIEQAQRDADYIRYRYDELAAADLRDGELQELEQRSEQMTHAEEIKTALYEAQQSLDGDDGGAVAAVRRAQHSLEAIAKVMPATGELAERLASCHIELRDIADEVSRMTEDTEFDPAELDHVNSRIDTLYALEQKYHADDIATLIAQRDDLRRQLDTIENSDDTLHEMEQRCTELQKEATATAKALTTLRTTAAKKIESQMTERLSALGMPHVRFHVDIKPAELSPAGADSVAFLFSANTSTPLQPIAQVASGGEIARLMLSLKAMISGAVKLPTIIFDEIDTGVSGKMAERMGDIMGEMGRQGRQVIAITHLPQIAACATSHYRVVKEEGDEGTVTHMTQLDTEGRIEEIAQMLSGSKVTPEAIANAKQLMKMKK